MESKGAELSKDILQALENLTLRVEALEKEMALLKGEPLAEETSAEPIDLSLEPLPVEEEPVIEPAVEIPAEPEPVPEPLPEPEPHAEPEPAPEHPATEPLPEPEPEPEPSEDLPAGLFGEGPAEPKAPTRGRRRRILNDIENPAKNKAVMDVLADGAAWRHDIPGPEVKSLRSAIGLGDQVLFIRRLFRDDSALYQSSIDKLNSMDTLGQVIEYLSDTFPEWDVASDDVYRFMMAVRRKVRK